jgi:hypothetical protein
MVIVEKFVKWSWEGGNLPQRHFVHVGPGLNPGRLGGKPATNHLSYVAALFSLKYHFKSYIGVLLRSVL